MSRHWGIATGGKAAGELPSRPRSEPDAQRGSNVIQLADHQTAPSPDDRLNSERLTAARLFTQTLIDILTVVVWTVLGAIFAVLAASPVVFAAYLIFVG